MQASLLSFGVGNIRSLRHPESTIFGFNVVYCKLNISY